MGIIPLKKLIEYKGNRYELSKAMIELAKSGEKLLKAETKYRNGKYIPTVIKNILDGTIKYEYEKDTQMTVDEEAPFKHTEATYNDAEYVTDDEVEETIMEDIDDDDDEITDNYEEEEKPKRKKRASKKSE
ncbi:hypothetical protein [uncultured Brachyspira sp.]|uniref:hypothetical protein n=1 Tax=uncultured Brachyspira sp. TaxID=221953 RepID=UPI0025896D07|nr:hypothetical protein [uncultured Brachyspira sp.]